MSGISDEIRKWCDINCDGCSGGDYIDEDGFNELRKFADRIDSEMVELPKDAYGEYIHEHDKVDWLDHAGTWHENATVVAVCDDGCYVMDGTVFHVHKSNIRHHHEPTVVDVMREFAEKVIDSQIPSVHPTYEEAITEYAAKLRLADDGEEEW